jgi:N-acyl-D-aspartate/D-glutamate deacylase
LTETFDLLIADGTLVDGTGAAGVPADLGIRGDRVVAIGDLTNTQARRRVEASKRIVCPGFIDAHSHSDLSLLSDGRALSKVYQGVTTEIVGNCGLGVAPLEHPSAIAGVRDAIYIVDPDPSVPWQWSTMSEYFNSREASGISLRSRPAISPCESVPTRR